MHGSQTWLWKLGRTEGSISHITLVSLDWFIKSRTTQELARRCDTLIRLVEKENQEHDERERQARKEKKLAKVPFATSHFDPTLFLFVL